MISTGAPIAADVRARNSCWLLESRTALVATARTAATSSFWYCAAIPTSAVHKKSIASWLMRPARNTLAPKRVTCRSDARMRGASPAFTSAASMRTELLPMSMAAKRGIPVSEAHHQVSAKLLVSGAQKLTIYVLRHGIAEDGGMGQPDSQRELTSEGRAKLAQTLKRAAAAGVQPSVILTSPYVRALETAKIAAQTLDTNEPLIRVPELTPDGNPPAVWDQIRNYPDAPQLLLVGHEPLLSQCVSFLLNAPTLAVDFKKGALVAIHCAQLRGQPRGVLLWMLTARLAAE